MEPGRDRLQKEKKSINILAQMDAFQNFYRSRLMPPPSHLHNASVTVEWGLYPPLCNTSQEFFICLTVVLPY